MQHRVRIGLIGLAWVFLLVMLATTFVHIAGGDQPELNRAAGGNAAAPSEPLAELGVAPGNPERQDIEAPPRPRQHSPEH